jgi:hypothetical protein
VDSNYTPEEREKALFYDIARAITKATEGEGCPASIVLNVLHWCYTQALENSHGKLAVKIMNDARDAVIRMGELVDKPTGGMGGA